MIMNSLLPCTVCVVVWLLYIVGEVNYHIGDTSPVEHVCVIDAKNNLVL